MRVVIQRVSEANVTIEAKVKDAIGRGLLLLVGFEEGDTSEDLEWMARKVIQLRIFDDTEGVMNLDVKTVNGDILVISQFTLHALTKKGNRPSYIRAARPETAIPMYEQFLQLLESLLGRPVGSGRFGADMKVSLVNDGPVTILIDSKNRE